MLFLLKSRQIPGANSTFFNFNEDDAPGKEAERNEMTDNVPRIQATDEEDVEDSSVDNSDVLQPLPPSSPESKSSSLTPSPSRSPLLQSDAPSDSTEADEAIGNIANYDNSILQK